MTCIAQFFWPIHLSTGLHLPTCLSFKIVAENSLFFAVNTHWMTICCTVLSLVQMVFCWRDWSDLSNVTFCSRLLEFALLNVPTFCSWQSFWTDVNFEYFSPSSAGLCQAQSSLRCVMPTALSFISLNRSEPFYASPFIEDLIKSELKHHFLLVFQSRGEIKNGTILRLAISPVS